MRVETIDPDDDEALAELQTVFNAAARHDLPTEPELSLSEMREIAKGYSSSDAVAVLARAGDGAVVGGGIVMMPTRDNLEIAELFVQVHPDHRRRGAGTEVVEHLERIATDHGRSSYSGQSSNVIGAQSPAEPFATKLGYVAVLEETHRRLDLPVAAELLDDLEQANAPFADGYEIVCWQDHCAPELVEGMAELERGMSTDAPHGDLTHEPQVWDADRVRQLEDMALKMGNTSYLAGAVHRATGHLVAYTVIGVNKSSTETARQWATIVNRDHRGHRLGILVKVANLRQLLECSPATRAIQTANANTNTHMMGVNALLGFYAFGQLTAWQKDLTAGSRPAV